MLGFHWPGHKYGFGGVDIIFGSVPTIKYSVSYLMINIIYVKSFEGENFCSFRAFLLTANVLPLKFFLIYQRYPLTTQSMVPPGLTFSTVKVFPTY